MFRVEYDDDLYKIHVKVENFKPEELIVKTVDNTVQVVPALYHQKKAHPGSRRRNNRSGIRPIHLGH